VPGRVRAEGVGGDELLGAGLQPELGGGDDEVGVPAHGAVGAVADPRHHARCGLDLPPHPPAVAAAAVDDDRRLRLCLVAKSIRKVFVKSIIALFVCM